MANSENDNSPSEEKQRPKRGQGQARRRQNDADASHPHQKERPENAPKNAKPDATIAPPAEKPRPVNPHKIKREENARKKAEEEVRKQAVIDAIKVLPPARATRPRKRHWGVFVSFFIFVIAPLYLIWLYLEKSAADQYVSHVGFAVRTEEVSSTMELLGGLTQLSSASSSDPDILYEFIQSQELVRRIDNKLDLRAMYSKPENDPFFVFDKEGTIEDLVDYWARMVKINYDGAAGLLELRVLAFDPNDAQNIAEAIFQASTAKINDLSAIARADATRYAQEELVVAIERLKKARRAITDFRTKHQLVNPQGDIQGQIGLLNTLQQQLAETLISYDLLLFTTAENDPRIVQTTRKIDVIRARIEEERNKFGNATSISGEAYSVLVGAFEELEVDREFAQEAYLSALSGFDQAKAEAERQSRYLAPYILPTLAERSTYPRVQTIMLISAIFIFLAWATLVLLSYAIKDRR